MSFNPAKDIIAEKFPGTTKVRMMRCIPCAELIYEVEPEDTIAMRKAKWNKLALHMALMHDSEILSDTLLRIPNKGDQA